MIDNLVEAWRGEIGKLHFDDWPHSFNGRADRRAHNRIFADRRIDHSPGKLLGQVLGGLKSAAERADILAVNKNPRVFRQGTGLRFPDGLQMLM